jgi:hypothetical protein
VGTSSATYTDHSPGTSYGFGMVVYYPAFSGFDYRGSVGFQNRKFNLTYNDGIERHNTISTLDFGMGLSTEFEMIGFFAGLEGTWLANVKCRGTSPCKDSGGDILAAQIQAGFSLGNNHFKLEPYVERMPFRPITGTKSMTTYGLAIHFFPETFSAE